MDKIPDTVKIDCLTISTVVLKSVIEEHLERLSDGLVLALKRKVNVKMYLPIELKHTNKHSNSECAMAWEGNHRTNLGPLYVPIEWSIYGNSMAIILAYIAHIW